MSSLQYSYKNYIQRIQHNLSRDPKNFWAFVNEKKKTSGFPSTMSFGNTKCSNPSEICDQFAKFSESVYVSDTFNVSGQPLSNNNINVCQLSFSYDSILNELFKINDSKGSGPDSIPPIFLKKCAVNLAIPLQIIFNDSLKSGIFPSRWKPSFIIPIFKSGSRKKNREL